MWRSKTLAWLIAGVVTAALPVFFVLDAGAGPYGLDASSLVLRLSGFFAALCVGLVLALKRPTNPIGWLLLSMPVAMVPYGLAGAYAGYALNQGEDWPGVQFAAVWDTRGWPLVVAGLVAVAFVFPDGRLPSARWRPAVVLGAVSFAMVLIGGLTWDEPLDAPFQEVEPFATLPSGVAGAIHNLGLAGVLATVALAALAVASRFRGAGGVLRLQLKWVAYAQALVPVALVVGVADGVLLDRDPGVASDLAYGGSIVALTVAIGIAVLRYRLYEIDRLISVTVVYGVLTALLGAAFAAISLGGGVALGAGSTVPTAAATLAVALAFRPLRSRVQNAVDRRFNPERHRGVLRIDHFLSELRLGRAEPEAVGEMLGTAVSDPSLRLYFWLPRDGVHADRHGRVVVELPQSPGGRTPVRRGELLLATLLHDPELEGRPDLLEALIAHSGLAIEIARLRVEVRHQVAEVEASRARIVSAADAERRRLERELHDGAQQRLVSVGLELRHLQRSVDDSERTRSGLDGAVSGLTAAIAELRDLARGIRSPEIQATR
jgi:signal transduction histidine kinase